MNYSEGVRFQQKSTQLDKAREMIRSGESIENASRVTGIPFRTLEVIKDILFPKKEIFMKNSDRSNLPEFIKVALSRNLSFSERLEASERVLSGDDPFCTLETLTVGDVVILKENEAKQV